MKKYIFLIFISILSILVCIQTFQYYRLKTKLKVLRIELKEANKGAAQFSSRIDFKKPKSYYKYFTMDEIIMDHLVLFVLNNADIMNPLSFGKINTVGPDNEDWMTSEDGRDDFIKGKLYCGLIKMNIDENGNYNWYSITQLHNQTIKAIFQKYKHLLYHHLNKSDYNNKYKTVLDDLVSIHDHIQSVPNFKTSLEEFKENNQIIISKPLFHEELMKQRKYNEKYQFFMHSFWGRRFMKNQTQDTYAILKEIQIFYEK